MMARGGEKRGVGEALDTFYMHARAHWLGGVNVPRRLEERGGIIVASQEVWTNSTFIKVIYKFQTFLTLVFFKEKTFAKTNFLRI